LLLKKPTNSGVQASAHDNTTSLASSDVGTREDDVLLVLVDGAWVGHGIGVLDDGHGFTSQDRLVNTQSGGEDLDEADVGGNLVSDGHLNNVARNDFLGAHLLDTRLVATDDLAHLGLVLLQSLNGGLRIALLPHTDDGVGDQNKQND
jgi:hypothetical protein